MLCLDQAVKLDRFVKAKNKLTDHKCFQSHPSSSSLKMPEVTSRPEGEQFPDGEQDAENLDDEPGARVARCQE